eukprot:tig00020943_g16317.t1
MGRKGSRKRARQPPTDDENPFDVLPDDLVLRIFSELEATTLPGTHNKACWTGPKCTGTKVLTTKNVGDDFWKVCAFNGHKSLSTQHSWAGGNDEKADCYNIVVPTKAANEISAGTTVKWQLDETAPVVGELELEDFFSIDMRMGLHTEDAGTAMLVDADREYNEVEADAECIDALDQSIL